MAVFLGFYAILILAVHSKILASKLSIYKTKSRNVIYAAKPPEKYSQLYLQTAPSANLMQINVFTGILRVHTYTDTHEQPSGCIYSRTTRQSRQGLATPAGNYEGLHLLYFMWKK